MAHQQKTENAVAKDQSLSLRVMRLCKPSFKVHLPLLPEKHDLAGDPVLSKQHSLGDGFPLSQMLILPQSFGIIYLGEKFCSYVSIFNTSLFAVTNVTIKAELQTSSARHTLLDIPSSQILSFPSGSSRDYIVEHSVGEYGVHILVCSASYSRHDGEKKLLRKYFKFNVERPFAVKTRNYLLNQELFVEVQVQNSTKSPLYVASVNFSPSTKLESQSMNDPSDEEKGSDMFVSGLFCMNGGNCRSYIYQLRPVGGANLQDIDLLGSMEIQWKSTLGDKARQSIDIFQQKAENPRDFDVKLSKIPQSIIVETPFTIECTISNRSKASTQLRLEFVKNKMLGVMVNGLCSYNLGVLSPKSSKVIPLTLFPLLPGVQKISGIRIENQQNSEIYDFDDLLQVFVENRTE